MSIELLMAGLFAAADMPAHDAASRAIPDYPSACLVKSAKTPEPQRVTVVYDVDEKGRVANARVAASTESCFNRTAVKAVRGWRLSGGARAGVSTTFAFVLEDGPRVYADGADDEAPVPLLTAIIYPAACGSSGAQAATLVVDLTANGFVRNPRIKQSSDICVDEAAIAKARATRFTPPGYDGLTPGARDIELSLAFDPDARGVKAVDVAPPDYPAHCIARNRGPDALKVRVDVTNLGLVENVRLIGSTNSCLNMAVLTRAAEWRFRPFVVSDPKARRKDVDVVVTMAVDGARTSEHTRRRAVDDRLDAARRAVATSHHGEAQSILSALESAEADGLRRAELAALYGVRARARLAAGDKARALDDFRAAAALGVHAAEMPALEKEFADAPQDASTRSR